MNLKLHHFAYNIRPDKLELVLELLEKIGCKLSYREENARWCMIQQNSIPVSIQIIETNDKPISIDQKTNTHIAFLSNMPKEDIEQIKNWSKNKNVNFRQGEWSDKELWFDLPDVFINFVIEIMHTSIAE
ncbi:hypothetical protein HOK51_06950 [Candidatus Woesearchaeota archaeon]|jgi:hypothetical protein|nr:hypothetical protein [Candidatus Woesearchaeota archaeon]MBT6519561.1 hypothetical protein [Candidatus Woesearchaeota archaeon]MBT7367694.1 hypothetical protein [Candidatus Woesearchaeota archaeon]